MQDLEDIGFIYLFPSFSVFPLCRETILKTAKALVEDTKMLVSGAASGPDRLAQAAQSSAKTITQLTDVVKLGAASIGSDDPETQVGQIFKFFSSVVLKTEISVCEVTPVSIISLIVFASPQVVLINAVKDVAKALSELISATKCAAGKTADDPSMYQLKAAAKVSFCHITKIYVSTAVYSVLLLTVSCSV